VEDPRKKLEESLETAEAIALHYGEQSLAYFLDQIVVNASPEPARFGECADDWQRKMLQPLIPMIDFLARRNPGYRGPLRAMQILARGHNKSSLEAWIASFLLISSRRKIKGYILAADRDQGRLVLQAMEDLIDLNPWIARLLTVTQNVISGPTGFIEVLPCDHRSMMGLQGNFYIADEFVHWQNQKAWNSLVTGLRKVTPTVFVAISNAGLLDSWQHNAFLEAKKNPAEWVLFHRAGTLASWLDQEGIERDKRLIPPSEARRLYDNEWIDPAEEHDYLRRPEVNECVSLGLAMGLIYRPRRQWGVDNYVAAIDYGPKRDRTALVVLHQCKDKQIVIDRLDVWEGKSRPAGVVLVRDVEDWIREVQAKFAPRLFVVDPYQMEGTIQWMDREGYPVEAFKSRGGAGNYEMAQCLRALIVQRRLVWYGGAGDIGTETLADELVGLRVKRMPYGFRFDHEKQKHDDRAVAISMACLRALGFPATDPASLVMPPKLER
jgi:hypothetical protein